MRKNLIARLMWTLLLILNGIECATADIRSDVENNLPLPQIVEKALNRQEVATNIVTELVRSCVKVASATGEVIKAVPNQSPEVAEVIVKAIVMDNIAEEAECREKTRKLASISSNTTYYKAAYKATDILELENITINEVPYKFLDKVVAATINAIPYLEPIVVIHAIPVNTIEETINAVESTVGRDVVAMAIRNETLSGAVVSSRIMLGHRSDMLAVTINLAGITDRNDKVTVCHKDKNTLVISNNALQAHLNHGDTKGACAETNRTVVMLFGTKKKRKHHDGDFQIIPELTNGRGPVSPSR